MIGKIVRNIKKNGLKYITPKRGFMFFRSLVRKKTKLKLEEKDIIEFSEIIVYKKLTCPDCVELGHCKICECPINELFAAMEAPCSEGKFPAFKKNGRTAIENWRDYKKENNIHLMKFED